MFSLKEWLKNAFVRGVAKEEFSKEYVAVKCAEQVDKGRFSESDAKEVYTLIEGLFDGGKEIFDGHTD